MSKPKWEDAPNWAWYLCKDADQKWHWFEFSPTLVDGKWEITYKTKRLFVVKFKTKITAEDTYETRPQKFIYK